MLNESREMKWMCKTTTKKNYVFPSFLKVYLSEAI